MKILNMLVKCIDLSPPPSLPPQKAKKKPQVQVDPEGLGLDLKDLTSRISVLSVEDPPVREAGSKVADVDELVSKLKEAGVI